MNRDKPSTSKASDYENLSLNPPAKRRRPDARMSKNSINVEFGQSSDEPFDFFDPRSAEVWNAPLPPRNPPVFDSRSTMTNDFDSIFSEIMESTTKPSIQTSNADDLADLDELIQNMPINEEGKFFYPELPPDLPTNPDEILLPEDEDDDEELTPTSPMKVRPSKNSKSLIELANPSSEKTNAKKIDSLLEHNLLLQKPLEKFVNDLKRRITYLKTKKLIIRAEIDEEHDRLHRRSRGIDNGETLSSFQKPYFFDRIQTASPYNDPDVPNDSLFLEKMKFCEDFVMNQMDYEMSPRQEQMLKNLIRQEVEAKLKNEINESLMSDERRWWERLMSKFEKKESEKIELPVVESEADKIREQSKEKLKSKIDQMKEQGENIVGKKVEVDWMLIACKLNTLALQCNVKMTSKRITHLTSRERLQYGANGVHPFQAYIHWDRKLHPDLRKKKLTAKEVKLIQQMREEEELSWIEIAKKLSKPDARVTSMAVFKAFRLQEVKKEKAQQRVFNKNLS